MGWLEEPVSDPHNPSDLPLPEAPPRRDRGLAGWARRQQAAKEAALGPVGRIELALRLGLRARALRAAAGR